MGIGLTLRQKGLMIIALPLLLQLCFIALLFHMEKQAETDYWWELHSKTVLARANKLDSLIVHLESAARGYTICGDQSYKKLYLASLQNLPNVRSDMSLLVRGNAVQTAAINKINQLTDEKVKFNNDIINFVDRGQKDEANKLIKTKLGIKLTNGIEYHLALFTKDEEELFEQRIKTREQAWQIINWTLIAALMSNIMIIIMLVRFSHQEISRRIQLLIDNMERFATGQDLNPVISDIAELRLLDEAFRDTTRKVKSLTQELKESRDQAVQASRFKSEFLANVSHEIRTPMNGIVGMADLLSRTALNEQQKYLSKVIKDSSKALLSIINDVLDFSKVEVGKLTLEVVDFEVASIVEDSTELFADKASQKHLSLMTFIDPNLPHFAKGDPGRLRQVLLNIISNAIKFTEHGEVLVRVSLEASSENTFTALFEVTDSGIGVSEKNQALLFRPFVQAEGATTRRFGGTGLGLSICKSLVELMNGELGMRSSEGDGSTFWFTVPLQATATEMDHNKNEKPFQALKILVIDDEKTASEILSIYTQSWGMACDTVSSGMNGIKKIQDAAKADNPYDFAIIDLVMPDMNGFDVGKSIKKLPDVSSTKLILLTAFDEPNQAAKALSQGFAAYLTKPVKQSSLFDCIADLSEREVKAAYPVKFPGAETTIDKLFETHPLDKNKLVLIVEDNLVNQEVALLELEGLGLKAQVAGNGKEALEILVSVAFDLILMDCQMPELDGFQATSKIRQMEESTGKHIPIIAMTAQAMQGDRQRCIEAGMDDYISKPIYAETLIQVLAKWIPAKETVSDKSNNQEDKIEGESMTIEEVKDNTIFDITNLQKRFGADKCQLLFDLFSSTSDELIEKLGKTIEAKDTQSLKFDAHQLKGSCLSIGAAEMSKLCLELEECSKTANWSQAEESFSRLEKAYDSVKRVANDCFVLAK